MTTGRESLNAARYAVLREKAGDGSTDFFVEVRQSDLSALLAVPAVGQWEVLFLTPDSPSVETVWSVETVESLAVAALADCKRVHPSARLERVDSPPPEPRCPCCHDVGWYLDYSGGGNSGPLTLELLPCIRPECKSSGQRLEHLSVNEVGFNRVVQHGGHVMAVGRG